VQVDVHVAACFAAEVGREVRWEPLEDGLDRVAHHVQTSPDSVLEMLASARVLPAKRFCASCRLGREVSEGQKHRGNQAAELLQVSRRVGHLVVSGGKRRLPQESRLLRAPYAGPPLPCPTRNRLTRV